MALPVGNLCKWLILHIFSFLFSKAEEIIVRILRVVGVAWINTAKSLRIVPALTDQCKCCCYYFLSPLVFHPYFQVYLRCHCRLHNFPRTCFSSPVLASAEGLLPALPSQTVWFVLFLENLMCFLVSGHVNGVSLLGPGQRHFFHQGVHSLLKWTWMSMHYNTSAPSDCT